MKLKKYIKNIHNKYTMNVLMGVFVAVLFYVLTPGVFLSLPSGGSVHMKAAVHAVVFAVVYNYTQNMAKEMLGDDSNY